MSTTHKPLNASQRHILKLIVRGKKEDGWADVSEGLYHYLSNAIPTELAEFEKLERGGRARLTQAGQEIINALAWL